MLKAARPRSDLAQKASPSQRSELYLSIQYLRAFAAMLVVLVHADPVKFAGVNRILIGSIGVDIFFILSGFVMAAVTTHKRIHKPDFSSGIKFLRKRLIRVWPPYALCTGLALLMEFLLRGSNSRTIGHIVTSLILIPAHRFTYRDPILSQGWSLSFELLFYAMVALGLSLGRMQLVVFSGVAILAAFGALIDFKNVYFNLLTSSLPLEFLMGYSAFYINQKYNLPRLSTLLLPLAAGGLVLAMLGVDSAWKQALPRMSVVFGNYTPVPRFLAWGVPALVLVLATLSLEDRFRMRPCKPFLYLGNASYSLYLTHTLVFMGLDVLFRKFSLLASLTYLTVPVCIACVFHQYVEKPLTASFAGHVKNQG